MLGPGDAIVDRYLLWTVIAEGSMGSVWLAQHRTLERPFAVKFLKAPSVATHRVHERFVREARLTAAIRSPNVVDVVDYGVLEDGTPFMVMELLEGEPLARRLRREPALPVRELLRLVAQVLDGLDAVHAAGVVHRDVKPENVVLVCRSGEIVPKLIDFGVCCMTARDAPGGHGARLTAPGTTFGTPWYMSPEHAAGFDVDGRTDLYGVGVMLYEGLAGRLPFEAPGGDVVALLRAVVAGGATPLAELRPDLPEALIRVVERAMSTDPEARFATAAEMAEAVRAIADGLGDELACPGVPAAPAAGASGTVAIASPPPVAITPRARRRSWLRPAAAAAALALALLGGRLALSRRASRAPDVAIAAALAEPPLAQAVLPPAPEPPVIVPLAREERDSDRIATVSARRPPRRTERRGVGAPLVFRHPGF